MEHIPKWWQMPHAGNMEDQVGWGSEQPEIVEDASGSLQRG